MARTLNDTQRIILATAGGRDDLRVLSLPFLRAPMVAVRRTIASLVKNGLLEEFTATPTDPIWRETEDGGRVALIITVDGLRAIGIADGPAAKPASAITRGRAAAKAGQGAKTPRRGTAGRGGGKVGRPETKQAIVVRMLRNGGASVPELAKATGWQEHSVRGVLTATIKKRLGLPLVSAKGEDGVRRYYIAVLRKGTNAVQDLVVVRAPSQCSAPAQTH